MIEYILLAICILMSAYYSGLEMGIYCLNRVRLKHRLNRGWKTAKILDRHLKKPEIIICTILIGNNIVNFITSAVFTNILHKKTSLIQAELYTTLFLAPVLLIFAEVIPKNLFRQKSDTLLYSVAPTLDISHKLFYPLSHFLKMVSKVPFLFFKNSKNSEDYSMFTPRKLMYYFMEGAQDGSLSRYQNVMTRNILRLDRTSVKKVMIKLNATVSIPYDIDMQHLTDLIRDNPFSRLPVYRKKQSKIIGVINLLEFLSLYEQGDTIDKFVNDVTFIDQYSSVDDTLFRLQHNRQRMGIVIDKNKRAIGIVTIKDLVEEIVGELAVW